MSIKDETQLDLAVLNRLLQQVQKTIRQAPDVVRYRMNSFVISVGSYVQPLTDTAIQTLVSRFCQERRCCMTNSHSGSAAASESRVLTRTALIRLFVLFFSSGALALIYEVIWQRQFALVLGGAAPAAAAVLAAYFAGLGLGSFALGAAAARWPRPLRAYAALEALIAVGALLVAPLLSGLERLHPWLFERLSQHPSLFCLAKALLAFFPLAIPTFCMGGTLPVLGRLVDAGQRRLGCNAGLLYVANTVGAAAGALCVPFFLLPVFGVNGSTWLCATGNLFVALAAWQMDHHLARDANPQPQAFRTHDDKNRLSWKSPVLVLALLSGLVTFMLQVLWNRAFAQVHENSVYSFAVLVSIFILALAFGAQLARVGLKRRLAPHKLIGWAWVLGGAAVMVTPWLFLRLTDGLRYLPSDGGWSRYALRIVEVAMAVLMLPVTFLGVGLPVIMEQAGQQQRADSSVLLGRVLSANVIGSVIGALAAGFLLPRWIGVWSSVLLTAALLVTAGIWQLVSMKNHAGESPFSIGASGGLLREPSAHFKS